MADKNIRIEISLHDKASAPATSVANRLKQIKNEAGAAGGGMQAFSKKISQSSEVASKFGQATRGAMGLAFIAMANFGDSTDKEMQRVNKALSSGITNFAGFSALLPALGLTGGMGIAVAGVLALAGALAVMNKELSSEEMADFKALIGSLKDDEKAYGFIRTKLNKEQIDLTTRLIQVNENFKKALKEGNDVQLKAYADERKAIYDSQAALTEKLKILDDEIKRQEKLRQMRLDYVEAPALPPIEIGIDDTAFDEEFKKMWEGLVPIWEAKGEESAAAWTYGFFLEMAKSEKTPFKGPIYVPEPTEKRLLTIDETIKKEREDKDKGIVAPLPKLPKLPTDDLEDNFAKAFTKAEAEAMSLAGDFSLVSNEMGNVLYEGLSGAFHDAFGEANTLLGQLALAVLDSIARMIAQIAANALLAAFLSAVTGGAGGGFSGIFSKLMGGIFHEGGVVEKNNFKDLSQTVKQGLAYDEVPVILQTGERVLSREQNKEFVRFTETLPRAHSGAFIKSNKNIISNNEEVLNSKRLNRYDQTVEKNGWLTTNDEATQNNKKLINDEQLIENNRSILNNERLVYEDTNVATSMEAKKATPSPATSTRGGQTIVNLNVSAMDASTFKSWLVRADIRKAVVDSITDASKKGKMI